MISVKTIADICSENYVLGLYCMHCDRWGEADLQQLLRCGKGEQLLFRSRFRCQECGQVVDKQLRPPVPTPGGSIGYIRPIPAV